MDHGYRVRRRRRRHHARRGQIRRPSALQPQDEHPPEQRPHRVVSKPVGSGRGDRAMARITGTSVPVWRLCSFGGGFVLGLAIALCSSIVDAAPNAISVNGGLYDRKACCQRADPLPDSNMLIFGWTPTPAICAPRAIQ
ncbi:t22.9 [Tupaiid betaherpesvirus 1]|uniref:T22.9 n=1 Tax=Tupaiid herpesvirus 1 (strain 1) TaxID=10397 RepID=Q91TT0_TUHV1|nr:t22.9 [Tupaiid betaherpesvirus 1]AAK57057.1 t22.9 [Tupaiid betaherpesvirus 1]